MTVKAQKGLRYIDEKSEFLTRLSDEIWGYAELGLREYKSAECLAKALEEEGFTVRRGVAGMPTAFEATWGEGSPVIGFLAEYDALPGVSQKAIPVREELVPGGPGHGCGHNLLGVGSLAAAIGLKHEMESRKIKGTVKYFGCPAEENFSGKAFMAREGLFSACDACLTWHAGAFNRVKTGSSLANNAMNVTFYGRTAHAAGDPYNGRSALDALQLMNLGVEFLREHMPPRARIHYVITDGGMQPNVVPARASAWYLIRSPEREQVDELYRRVLNCAYGAAQMTDTRCEIELIKAIWNVLPNDSLGDLLEECFERVGPPKFSAEDLAFAEEISKTFAPGQREAVLKKAGIPTESWGQILNDTVIPRPETPLDSDGSTDVADCSWCCPTNEISAACHAIGTPGHSWQYTAQAGMSIGHKGMLTAGKVMAEAGFVLMTEPDVLRRCKEEFLRRTGGKKYVCAIPEGQGPKFDQFK